MKLTPTSTPTTTRPTQTDRHTPLFDLSQALQIASSADSPAALTEAMLPRIRDSFWLLVSSNSVIEAQHAQAVSMILERAIPSGVSVALDLDWQPQRWGLPPQAPPSAEVLRRVQPLAWSAQLIRCSREEAEAFFGSADPVRVHRHDSLPQRPAVLIRADSGALDWCIGGRLGSLEASMLQDHDLFLTRLLDNLSSHPELLGNAGPGLDAVADPDGMAEQLLSAALAGSAPLSDG